MSVRQGLLALLAQQPMYGAQLRSEFEARTGGTWPLNVGQVYTTLARLERDGLVEEVGADDEGRISYRLTRTGRAEVAQWWLSPVDRETTPRDELVIKLALAVTVEGVDVHRVVQTQRTATLRHLQDLTRLKQRATTHRESAEGGDGNVDLAWLLVLENLIYSAEAEVRWLDHVEARLVREASRPRRAARTVPTADDEGLGPAGSSSAPHRTTTTTPRGAQ
ncbi:PadR family transcriptional regulator [Phycicoccus sp. Soil748]|uniref:PadR family transcriptional regulator n=1 Tax=Phycicoccus sp. Soil748 TaxID=1736397 RepID=UPI000702BB6E|nr:PadR family transcriptional regulator [Phycicoccus sp. Soil748]KRE54582.1 PadR family transcriptional regulator [Phycicoccus sp. Soil748]